MECLTVAMGARRALLLLPGAQMHPHHVEQAGVPAALRASGVALDLIVPDLHLDPTGASDAVAQLEQTLVAPLRRRYPALWLGGISFGALLALRCAQHRGTDFAGLCLIAPYGGSRLTTNAIARAGGLDAWAPTAAQRGDVEFQLWLALRAGKPKLPTFLGYGRDDRFAGTMRALAARLPQVHQVAVAGGHDWLAWLPLWRQFLSWLDREGGGG